MAINYWRRLESDCVYHIYSRTIGKEKLFINQENYRYFLDRWKRYLPYLDVYAYCLMPNHFHFLAKVKPLDEALLSHVTEQDTVRSRQFLAEEITYGEYLEDQFKRLLGGYTLAFNKEQKRHGSLFQKRFKRVIVLDEYKLHYLLIYIHHNPIHHNVGKSFDNWKYSSWSAYQHLNQTSFVSREIVLQWFDANANKAKKRFDELHRTFQLDQRMNNDALDEE